MPRRTVQRSELPALEDACMAFARAQHRFERLEATREQLGELFKVRPPPLGCPLPEHIPLGAGGNLCHPPCSPPQHNSFQLQRIQEEVTSPTATVYR